MQNFKIFFFKFKIAIIVSETVADIIKFDSVSTVWKSRRSQGFFFLFHQPILYMFDQYRGSWSDRIQTFFDQYRGSWSDRIRTFFAESDQIVRIRPKVWNQMINIIK